MGGNFGEVAVWDCAKCSVELLSYRRAGNCFPQMCLKLSLMQLFFAGGGAGGWIGRMGMPWLKKPLAADGEIRILLRTQIQLLEAFMFNNLNLVFPLFF